jgi:putative FmdB family regulatory protein
MPVYEYQCDACGKVVDLKHAFREEPPTTTCPACGASPLKRKFNAAGIIFKGSGYYINDSRAAKSEGAKAEASAAPATAPAATTAPASPKSDAAA